MAFTSVKVGETIIGSYRFTFGTWNGDSVTTGNIDTGLVVCDGLIPWYKGSSVESNAATLNETMPVPGSAVTIVFNSSDVGYWMAWGDGS